MDLDETIHRLKTAPRAGRKDFGLTVVLPESAVTDMVAALEKVRKTLARKPKPVVRGAEPE